MAEPILVLDDDPTNRKLLCVLLASAGYAVEGAGNAEEAQHLLRRFHPNLILMDLKLPGKDGLTLTRELKADPATRRIGVIALTACAMKGDKERALAAGCDGFITKPVNTRTLPNEIALFLARQAPPPSHNS